MRDFGGLAGADLVPLLTTLLQEGALASETETQSLQCIHEENGAKITLYFCSDYLTRAESTQESPPLADIFYAKRLLERGQREKIAELEKSQPYFSVGKYVIEQGWISQSDVAQTLITLIEIFAYEVMQWKRVHFQLKPAEPLPAKKISHIPDREFIPVTYFVADAEKNLPVLILMQQELADFRWVLRRLKEAQRGELSNQQAHVYRYVNHQRTLAKILQISDLGYFETLAASYQLIKWGYLGKGTRGAEPKLILETSPVPPTSQVSKPLSIPSAPITKTPFVQDSTKKSTSKYKIAGRHFLKRDRGSELFGIFEALFANNHHNGEVIVENQTDPFRASFIFREGHLLHATSSEVPVRLGDLLLKKKRISSSVLKQALQTQRDQSSVLLGQTLVKSGHLNAAEIDSLIYHQMAYVLYNVLGWSEVKFYFAAHAQWPQKTVQIPIQWQDKPSENALFYEAYTALPMLVMLKTKLTQLTQLTQVPVQFSLQNHTLSDIQRAVWMQIDGLTSFQDLLLISEEGYLETYTALYQMLSTHLIGFKQKGIKKAVPPREVPEPRQWSPVEMQKEHQAIHSPSPVTPPHPLSVLLGEELAALLIALPEHKHAALRQLLYSALEMA